MLLPAAPTAARLLRLGVVLLKRLCLNEEDIGLRRVAGVLRTGVNADQIARHHLVIFKRDQRLPLSLLRARLLQKLNRLFLAAVHRVVQRQFTQSEIIRRFDRNRHFLNRIHPGVLAWLHNLDGRRAIFARLNEIIVRQTHGFAGFQRTEMILAVFGDGHLGGVLIALPHLFKLDLLLIFLEVAQDQDAVFQWLVGLNIDFRHGAFHRAQVSAGVLSLRRQAGPTRVMIGHLQLGHVGQIDDLKVKGLRPDPARLDKIFH